MRCRTTEEPELLHQPDPALFCPICSRILDIPIRTNCGHTSCAECLRWHMATSPHLGCPECHAPIDSCSPQPDRFAEKIVGALECFCPERNDGCPWIGTRAGLAAHAKECRASRVRHTRADNSQYGKAHEPEPVRFGGWGVKGGGGRGGLVAACTQRTRHSGARGVGRAAIQPSLIRVPPRLRRSCAVVELQNPLTAPGVVVRASRVAIPGLSGTGMRVLASRGG